MSSMGSHVGDVRDKPTLEAALSPRSADGQTPAVRSTLAS